MSELNLQICEGYLNWADDYYGRILTRDPRHALALQGYADACRANLEHVRAIELYTRAIAVNPDLLIMDEPFSGLDFLTHMKMREEVVNMHEFIRKTTLVVTHDIDDALIMGDRIVVFSGRPAVLKMIHKLDFPRPRDFERDHGLSRLRSEIFLMLGVPYAV
ncbi:MAG: hypothetical protein HZB87_12890 [Desulfatitalea sp.]|nr:hypothetical protein [Desulfatitalea sp.]